MKPLHTAALLRPAVFVRSLRETGVMLLSSLLLAIALNLFLVPHQLLSGGVTGVASIIGYVSGVKISLLYFGLNIPLVIWGWKIVGRRYIVLSLLSVVFTAWFLVIVPVVEVSTDPIMSAVAGGIISAAGIGIALRAGGSTGGFDIIGSIVTRTRDVPMGTLLFALNGIVILLLGFTKNWDLALYSMLSIYIKGKVVDVIHVGHVKVTCFIITKETDRMLARLKQLPHGITYMETKGGYSDEHNSMLMTVTTRYELTALRKAMLEVDPKAFMNVVNSSEIVGRFARPMN